MILGWAHAVLALCTRTYATSILLPFWNDGEQHHDLTTTTLFIVYRLAHKVRFCIQDDGVIQLVFHVLQLPHQQNSYCISEANMKHMQKPDCISNLT